jgi:hypothetical protein
LTATTTARAFVAAARSLICSVMSMPMRIASSTSSRRIALIALTAGKICSSMVPSRSYRSFSASACPLIAHFLSSAIHANPVYRFSEHAPDPTKSAAMVWAMRRPFAELLGTDLARTPNLLGKTTR